MELDLETFLTTLYVMVDDLYQSHVQPQMPPHGGPPPQRADREVLCLALAAQWRRGVPWASERGCLRYLAQHHRALFPGLTSQSAFNRRFRRLWGAFLILQAAVAEQLVTPQECEIIDGVPVRVAHGARSFHPGWLAEIARIGKGGNDRYFYQGPGALVGGVALQRPGRRPATHRAAGSDHGCPAAGAPERLGGSGASLWAPQREAGGGRFGIHRGGLVGALGPRLRGRGGHQAAPGAPCPDPLVQFAPAGGRNGVLASV